jgi:succinoglycan biosynthesis protein ExoA
MNALHSVHFISIILPVRNEVGNIRLCLEHIFSQKDLTFPFEIIVVDGMSTDGTREVIREIQEKHPSLFMINNPVKIVSTGLNEAIRIAKGDFIIRIDGHTKIAPDYLNKCVETYQRTGAENVGGRMIAVGITRFGQSAAIATSTPFGVGGSRFHYSGKEEEVDSVYLGAWPKEVFSQTGLFDEELIRDQDDEFNYRLRAHGGKIIMDPDIKSIYTVRSTPQALWSQYYQYGFWKVRVLQKHPHQMSIRQFVPALFVGGMLGTSLFAMLTSWGWIWFVLAVGGYILANLVTSLVISIQKGWVHFIYLPIAFAILHTGYGLGFLIGLVKFWNRWGDKKGKVPEWRPVND